MNSDLIKTTRPFSFIQAFILFVGATPAMGQLVVSGPACSPPAVTANCVVVTTLPPPPALLLLNRDLSTGGLFQWTNRDYGLGTNVGSNASGAGYLFFHTNVLGRRAAGLTVTPTAHASPASLSDSVYLWEPTDRWNYAPTEFWLRTSFLFPSASTIAAVGFQGEAAYQPTTGEFNWVLELHNDSNPNAGPELANLAWNMMTDYPVVNGAVGQNPFLRLRIMGGPDSAIQTVLVPGPKLSLDHWYEFLAHVKLDPVNGIVEWFLDGATIYSNLSIPTLYTRPTGFVSPSYTSLTLPNYRLHAPWNSTVYVGPLAVGPTQSSVANVF